MELTSEKYLENKTISLPNDWLPFKLGEISSIIGGGTPSSFVKVYWNGDINWYTPTEIGNSKYSYESIRKITKVGYDNCSANMLPIGSILLTTRAGIGDISILMNEGCTNQGFQSFIAKEFIDNEFLYYLISTLKSTFLKNASGSTFLEISPNKIKAILVSIPPTKTEQTAIATALSDADALISSIEKLIAKKRNIKQGAMQKLLEPKEGWSVRKLGEVLKVKHGKDQKEVQNENGKYPILGTGGFMAFTDEFLYDKPSVLIGRKGTIDKPQFMTIPFWTVDTLFYTEIFNGYSAKFIYYIFNMIDWYSFNEASGVPSLNAKTIEKIERGFPNYMEQTRIAIILSDMDTEIEVLETKLNKYKKIKLGMMQNLLTGKIRLV